MLIDLPQLMYGGPGNLAGFVLSIRREWIALVALGSLIGWGVAKWSTGRPNKGMKLTRLAVTENNAGASQLIPSVLQAVGG